MATFKLNDRYAIIGKSGSGKTYFAVNLVVAMEKAAATFNRRFKPELPWRVVGINTKQSDEDVGLFKKIGPSVKTVDKIWGRTSTGVVFEPSRKNGDIVEQCQSVFEDVFLRHETIEDYRRSNVLLFIDEYKQTVISKTNPGDALDDVHARGRGLKIGEVGCTQEPVNVPRQLISQANHIFLFDFIHANDIKAVKEIFADYERPKDPHGFYYLYVDGRDDWQYFPSMQSFFGLPAESTQEPVLV